ncbi:hypothetical protein [Trabulsiella odontotermitis]|uniref:hypothetical protein n=1 Tax=Trabulsiella odontotermitis TaxID=379893 RepID=UPI0006BA1CB7|nr:hypothetical protein [Trabulsiella odontotermitis]
MKNVFGSKSTGAFFSKNMYEVVEFKDKDGIPFFRICHKGTTNPVELTDIYYVLEKAEADCLKLNLGYTII